jgi:trk system potassium uptake protein
MKSFLVIGLGTFGQYLAIKLMELNNEVMIVDKDEDRVNHLASMVTASRIGDCQDEEVLRALGVKNFDACFVCVSDDFQCSLEVTSMLKELGAKHVVARAERDKQAKFLKSIGADEVIHTELDMAHRAAVRFSTKGAFEYIELTPEYAIFEIETPGEWIGRTVSDVGVRSEYNLNVIGIKEEGEITPLTKANHVFSEQQHLIIAGSRKDAIRLMDSN